MKYLVMIGNFIKTHIVITVVTTATVSSLVVTPVIINNIKSEQEKIKTSEENNTENKTENKQVDIYEKYGDLTKLSNETFDLDENIEVNIWTYYLAQFSYDGECNNVVDVYGSIGQYGGSGVKCATNEIKQEAVDYLSNTPFIKYNGVEEIEGYKLYSISYPYFTDGRFNVEYKQPDCHWIQSVPEARSIAEEIHAYDITGKGGFKKAILDEDICKEYKLTCYRGEEQGKEIAELRAKMNEEKLKENDQRNQALIDSMYKDTQKWLEDELKKEQDLISQGYVVDEEMTKINCPHNGCKSYCLNWGDPNDPLSEIGGTCMTVYYTTNPDEE